MRRTSFALAIAAGVLGCGGCGARETSGRARLWTLFDVASILDANPDAKIARGGSFPKGIAAAYFAAKNPARPDVNELVASTGFIDGRPATYMTTELWANFEEVWVQPLYRAITAAGTVVDDPVNREPWVFGVGPDNLFYSPFWQVYGFQVPDGVALDSLLDTRAVLDAANSTGGLRKMERRITSLVPDNVVPAEVASENNYYDNTGAWDGQGGRRYIDFGPGRFDVDETGVVRAVPIFVFAKRQQGGGLEPVGWPNVGGTRPLFSHPQAVSNANDAGASTASVDIDPNFGGLWRLHTVELPEEAGIMPDGRVVLNGRCLDGSFPCVVLDSQTAIESQGADRIRETELMAACPLFQLGDATFPRAATQPSPPPSP